MKTYNSPLTEVNMIESALSMMNVSGGIGGSVFTGTKDQYEPVGGGSWSDAR